MAQPPMKWAVVGMLATASKIEPWARPPILSATMRAERLATGIQVGLGSPWPGSEVSQPKRPRRTRIELSRLCMTRRITERSDQFRTDSDFTNVIGCRRTWSRKRSGPGDAPAAVDHDRGQQAHGVGPLPVAHRLDVGLGVGVDRGGDGDAVGEVQVVVVGLGGDDGLAVGPAQVAEALGQPGQAAVAGQLVQQLLGADGGRPRSTTCSARNVRRRLRSQAPGRWVVIS